MQLMFNDYMLACDDKEAWNVFVAPFLDDGRAVGLNISEIGALVRSDVDGQEVSRNDAHHVNVRIDPMHFEANDQFVNDLAATDAIKQLNPKTPSRVWG